MDLRAELARAEQAAVKSSLKLGVEQIEVSLEVTTTLERSGEADARAEAKFWVFAKAEAGVKGSISSGRTSVQQLTLTLKPRVDELVAGADGSVSTVSHGLDVHGELDQQEENPVLPPVSGSR